MRVFGIQLAIGCYNFMIYSPILTFCAIDIFVTLALTFRDEAAYKHHMQSIFLARVSSAKEMEVVSYRVGRTLMICIQWQFLLFFYNVMWKNNRVAIVSVSKDNLCSVHILEIASHKVPEKGILGCNQTLVEKVQEHALAVYL